MSTDYRITIRTDLETADAFRDLAAQEELALGDTLAVLLENWARFENKDELCAQLTALKYNGEW